MVENELNRDVGEWTNYYRRLSDKTLAQEYLDYDLEKDDSGQRGISLADVVKGKAGNTPPQIWANIQTLENSQKKYVSFYLAAQEAKLDGGSKLYEIRSFLRKQGINKLYIAGGMKMDLEDINNLDQIRAAFNSRIEKGQEIYRRMIREYHQKERLII